MERKVEYSKVGPGVELRDPLRLELLRRLQSNKLNRIPQEAQASLLLCDLQYLQHLLTSVSNNPVGLENALKSLHSSKVDEIVAQC